MNDKNHFLTYCVLETFLLALPCYGKVFMLNIDFKLILRFRMLRGFSCLFLKTSLKITEIIFPPVSNWSVPGQL